MEIGKRFANLALQKTYGFNIAAEAPVFKSCTIENNEMMIHFDHIPNGLNTLDGKAPNWFEISETGNERFKPVSAELREETVVIDVSNIKEPSGLRFAWSETANPNLAGSEGIPVYPFHVNLKNVDKKFKKNPK